ncbi:MAG: SIS domain-containing protein [bacterium]
MSNAFTKLLMLSPQEKKQKGVEFTPAEIYQQPMMWRKTFDILEQNKSGIKKFLKGQEDRTILLTGAGTSAFIGLALEPLFNKISGFNAKAVGTTEIITDPDAYFRPGKKYIVIHFARSGNSPESVGTFVLAEESKANIKHIVITCNKNGKLAKMGAGKKALIVLLPPETDDKSLAMTSSFSSMVVAGQYIAALKKGGYKRIVGNLAVAAQHVMDNSGNDLAKICSKKFTRAVFMGSNTLFGCAKECHLKLQEETDGQVVAKFDTFLGLRHGPEAVIDKRTLVVYLLSEEPLTRIYELDMMRGIKSKKIGQTRLAFCRKADKNIRNLSDVIVEYGEDIPDDYLTPVGVLIGQMLGVLRSLSQGLKPDSPSAAGVISRVVQGVKIYDRPRFYKKGKLKIIAG